VRTDDRLFDSGPPSGPIVTSQQASHPASHPAVSPTLLPGLSAGPAFGEDDPRDDDLTGEGPLPAGRGRHRAPSGHSTRTAHRAVRGPDLAAARLAVAAAAGSGLVGFAAWLGVTLL